MDKSRIVGLLEELYTYIENDDIETISPVTHSRHQLWKSGKLAEIIEVIESLKEA